MNVCLLPQKSLSKGVTLTKQRRAENTVDLTLGPGECADFPASPGPAERRPAHPRIRSQGGRLCAEFKANKGKLQPDVGAFGFTASSWGPRRQSSSRTFLLSTRKQRDAGATGF